MPLPPASPIAVPDALQEAAQEVFISVQELAAEARALREVRESLETERESLDSGMASLIKIATLFGGAKADLLEQLRVEVALECEARLATQQRAHSEQIASLTEELQATLAELTAAKAELAGGLEPVGIESDLGELVPVEPEPAAPEPPKLKRRVAPRRRRPRF